MSETLTFDRFQVGTSFDSWTETPSEQMLASWEKLYGDAATASGELPSGIATVLMMRAYMHRVGPRPPGNIHARQQMSMKRPICKGDTITTVLSCVSKEMRKERRYVTLEATAHNQRGEPCFSGVMTLIWAA